MKCDGYQERLNIQMKLTLGISCKHEHVPLGAAGIFVLMNMQIAPPFQGP